MFPWLPGGSRPGIFLESFHFLRALIVVCGEGEVMGVMAYLLVLRFLAHILHDVVLSVLGDFLWERLT